jgi:mono/diheme cytochrome c family protein
MKRTLGLLVSSGTLAIALAACEDVQSIGFSLPSGDEEAGRQVFLEMACNDCHSIPGQEGLRIDATVFMDVPLGGPTSRIRTYGELVTSVINPSHRIAEENTGPPFEINGVSQMQNYNDLLTVSQLVDLVTFLEAQYVLIEYPRTDYSRYNYP